MKDFSCTEASAPRVYMKRSSLPFFQVCSSMMMVLAAVLLQEAQAQDLDSSFKLKIEPARKYVLKFGYTHVKPKRASGEAKDVTGPVLPYGTTVATSNNAMNWSSVGGPPLALQVIDGFGTSASGIGIPADHPSNPEAYSLGTPNGINNRIGAMDMPTISIQRYIGEEYKWALEAYVLGARKSNPIYGSGRIGGDTENYPGITLSDGATTLTGVGAAVNLGQVGSVKQAPLTAMLHYFFGEKSDKIRASLGIAMTYAIFYGGRSTASLDNYTGGPTTVKVKNAFGAGPVAGLSYAIDSRWSLNASVAYINLSTTATLTTKADPTVIGMSPATLQSAVDVGPNTAYAVYVGNTAQVNGTTGSIDALRKLAMVRTGDASNLGTYTREVETKMDPLVVTVSVGYAF